MDNAKVYTPEQIRDAERFIKLYMSVPESKRPIVAAAVDGFIAGMDAQKRLTEKQAG